MGSRLLNGSPPAQCEGDIPDINADSIDINCYICNKNNVDE